MPVPPLPAVIQAEERQCTKILQNTHRTLKGTSVYKKLLDVPEPREDNINSELKVCNHHAWFQTQSSCKLIYYFIQYIVYVSPWTTFQAHKSFVALIPANFMHVFFCECVTCVLCVHNVLPLILFDRTLWVTPRLPLLEWESKSWCHLLIRLKKKFPQWF